jgi:Holliday junction resolvasome RuvABC endonuclease subunit
MPSTNCIVPSLTDLTGYDEKPLHLCTRARVEELRQNLSDLSDPPPPGHCVLALDLGTQTGWALRSPDRTVISGSEAFKPGRFEGGGMRFLRFKRWLTELKATVEGLDAVFFEEVRRHAGVDAAHAYGGFMAHLTAWCEHHQIPYQGVPVGTIKKHATGKGNADKQAVLTAIRARGYAPSDDNEADALALLLWVVDTRQMETMT